MRALAGTSLLAALALGCASSPSSHAPRAPAASAREGAEEESWSSWGSLNWYLLPDDPDYALAVLAADRGALHLEARANYEDRETSSLWVGWNWASEDELELAFTPMLGAVFGRTEGIAPGYRLELALGPLDIASEGEYLFDLEDSSASYFYSWTELGYAATESVRVGLVGQRTRVFDTEREIDLGVLVGYGEGPWALTAYFFEPWDEARFFVLGASIAP